MIDMRKSIALFLVFSFVIVSGCGVKEKLDNQVITLEKDYSDIKSKVESLRSEVKQKRKTVKHLVNLYYGDSQVGRCSDNGVQDILACEIEKTDSQFTEKEKQTLRSAGDEVDSLVKQLKELDTKLLKIDKKYQKSTDNLDQFFKEYKKASKQAEDYNATIDKTTKVLLEALKLGVAVSKNA